MAKLIESRITYIGQKDGKSFGFIENPATKNRDDAYYFNERSLVKDCDINNLKINDIVLFETYMNNKVGKIGVKNLILKKDTYKSVTPPIHFKTKEEIFSGSAFVGEKSSAKVVGVKSVFYHDEKIVTTSFGKGNQAVMEKVLYDGNVQDINNPAAYDMDYDKRQLHFRNSKNQKESVITNPAKMKIAENGEFNPENVGVDQTRIKEPLEKIIFGNTYPDNIHIQIAYNILDIEKILAQYLGNIIYSLNNIVDTGDNNDFIGNLGYIKPYSKFGQDDKQYDTFKRFVASPKLAYYGNAFYLKNGKSAQRKREEDIYYMILLCGAVRQFCAHHYDKFKLALYTFDKDKKYVYINKFLDRLYKDKIKEVNNSFWATSGKSLAILMEILNISSEEGKKTLARDYYDFTVTKEHKNLGLSIKVLRETILAIPQAESLRKYVDNNQNSRKFIYKAIDFILYRDYRDFAVAGGIVEKLRSCQNKEDKINIYQSEAKKAWDRNGTLITDSVVKTVDEKIEEKIKTDSIGINSKMLEGVQLDSANVSSFVKLIYMITMLLDGKEINELLTTLVSKFDNIHSLNTVYKEITGENTEFCSTHILFADSGKIARDLRAVNSFARMEKALIKTKKEMFMDAARVLGTEKNDSVLEKYFDNMLDKSNSDKGFRNFIVNNVMESSRFNYLVRYADTKTVHHLAENENLIRFVLTGIPQPQIDRYYISCGGTEETAQQGKISFLVEKIKGVRFENFENVKQGNNVDKDEKLKKELSKNIIGLYLTYLYLVTKNLVNVNSRYFMAFHCLERDSAFKGCKIGNYYNECFDITKAFIAETDGKAVLNKKACEYMAVNMANTDTNSVKLFRNTVSHLGAVRKAYIYINELRNIKSYYAIYHYIVQREILNITKGYSVIKKYEKLIANNKSYNKDMVKALCSPLGYNLPRFKNLTIEDLFDKNKQETI